MKRFFLLPVLLCLSLLQAAAAEWTDDNGVTWTFSQLNWNYSGSYRSYYTITAAANYGDDVVVPETVYEGETPRTIEVIGGNLFYNNKTLSTVSLPSTIKYISSQTFYGCSALTTVGDISGVECIDSRAFYGCSSLTAVNLSNCKRINYSAFENCSSLTSIGSVAQCTYFGSGAFNNCSSLTTVDLQENVTLDGSVFSNCTSLSNIGTLNGVTIGSYAFYLCTSLTTVDLSQANSIGSSAFRECTNLQSVGDLAAFESIDNEVFYNCYKLSNVNLSNCKSIGNYAFYGCQKLQSVDLSNVKSMGTYAFSYCSALKTVGDISGFTSIPNSLFRGCYKLKNVSLPNVTTIGDYAFQDCDSLTNVSLPEVTSIGECAFSYCNYIKTLSLPKVTSIGNSAFYNCTNIESLTLPMVQTIGNSAFNGCSSLDAPEITSTALTSVGNNAFSTPGTITLMATTPATLSGNNAFGSLIVVRVPDAALATYKAADVWSDFKARIVGIGATINYDVNVTALDDRSTLEVEIGEANLGSVVSLKITGTINSYDIMVLRNKMDNLHYLDLSDANIVANSYEYYTGYHTEDNVLGGMSFYQLGKLISVKLPKSIKSIGSQAFYNCRNLKEVEFQTGLETIGSAVFQYCGNLRKIELKEGLKTIGSEAFGYPYGSTSNQPVEEELILPIGLESIGWGAFANNQNLKRVAFPSSLKTIGEQAFRYCYQLDNISLPTSLENIPSYAFSSCSSLTEARIPSTITSIGDQAFGSCPKLNDVYTYIAEPTPINMNTFSTYTTATLHIPATSKWTYWYDTEWSQFRTLEAFDADYEYFYINNDFTISNEAGTIHGAEGDDDPDADLNPGSGLIIETTGENTQTLNEVHIKMKGSDVASVIAASNFEANKVYFDIDIVKGKWYFLSFPFNVKVNNISAPGNYTFRIYDPEERANGKTGWQEWIGEELLKGQGYIFHCSKSGTLSLCVEKEDMNWDAETRTDALVANAAENAQDASWNFIGNPQTSYYDIEETGYDQPITVWNGTGYEAVRPGDDTYALSPFEAFFVQKPDNKNEMAFPEDGRYTQTQWEEAKVAKAAARRERGASIERQMINLTLTDGTHQDKTRVVFNERKSKGYEMECDAAKFLTSEKVPQLYTIDLQQARYAINERPTGEVRLGYVAATGGELTIKAMRMDQPVLLRDTKLQITHDLSMGDYTFSTAAGTFNDRFMLVIDNSATAVGKLRQETGVSVTSEEGGLYFMGITDQPVNIYSLSGTLLAANVKGGMISLPKATYLVKVNNLTTKVMVR